MKRIVELAAASLPWAVRDRYREEWLHDLEHADEVGARPGDVAWGAVRTAVTIDRMQAPSPAHALLQARLRVDAAGMHGTVSLMLVMIAFSFGPARVDVVTVLLASAALANSVLVIVRLHLAARTIGGVARLAAPLWMLGLVLVAVAGALALAGDDGWFGVATAGAACAAASALAVGAVRPPKPFVVERVRPAVRRRLLIVGAGLGAGVVALSLLDALVLLPLRLTPGATLDEAWSALIAAGGPASPLIAAAVMAGIMIVPLALGAVGAMRWARTERGILSWAAGGAFFAVMVTPAYGAVLALTAELTAPTPSIGSIPPLLAGLLLHFTYRGGPDLAPLPPASVPLPPGPWHVHPGSHVGVDGVPNPTSIP